MAAMFAADAVDAAQVTWFTRGAKVPVSVRPGQAGGVVSRRARVFVLATEEPSLFAGVSPAAWLLQRQRFYSTYKALYRIFAAAEYRFYRSNTGPPAETDTPFATSASLPHSPATLFADGDWRLAVSFFNGVLDSGFLPIGPKGEKYRMLRVVGGQSVGVPPDGPSDFRLIDMLQGGLIVRVHGLYTQAGPERATEWAITYTLNGPDPGEPPAVAPTATVPISSSGIAVLAYDLPSFGTGAARVRLQTRRPDGAGYAYSIGSVILTLTPNRSPTQPLEDAWQWVGRLPEV